MMIFERTKNRAETANQQYDNIFDAFILHIYSETEVAKASYTHKTALK